MCGIRWRGKGGRGAIEPASSWLRFISPWNAKSQIGQTSAANLSRGTLIRHWIGSDWLITSAAVRREDGTDCGLLIVCVDLDDCPLGSPLCRRPCFSPTVELLSFDGEMQFGEVVAKAPCERLCVYACCSATTPWNGAGAGLGCIRGVCGGPHKNK